MKDYEIVIRGVVPIMHNRYPLDPESINKKEPRGTVFDPVKKSEKCFYRNAKGEIYQPADHIEGALIMVGSSKTIPGLGKKTYKDQMKTNIAVLPVEIPFPDNGKNFHIDVRLGAIPSTRGKIPIARPMWNEWEFAFIIRVFDETMIDKETLKELLETAGRTKGIGTYRPKYGRFEVVSFEEIK